MDLHSLDYVEIGGGTSPVAGYFQIDARNVNNTDLVAVIPPIPLPNDSIVKRLYTSHFVEHVRKEEQDFLFAEFYRVLRPGAKLYVCVPDIQLIAKLYVEGKCTFNEFEEMLYGGREYAENQHYVGYNVENMIAIFEAHGFVNVQEVFLDHQPRHWVRVEGTKK